MKTRMYEINRKRTPTWNPHPGCKYDCKYCYAPEIYNRFSECDLCKSFVPHVHPERLTKFRNFKPNETIFVESTGDFAFIPKIYKERIIDIIRNYPKTTFYLQSKNPKQAFLNLEYPSNIVLGTTIETNNSTANVSKAPSTAFRKDALMELKHNRKYVTVEPILDFNLDIMLNWLKQIKPEFVYIGYLNPLWKAKKLKFKEPKLKQTNKLIRELKKITEVRKKTIRKSWSE